MVEQLSGSSFKTGGQRLQIKGVKTPSMLLIHASWCGHCKTFKPVYEKLGKKLKGSFPLLSIEDTHINKDLGQALNFKGYPSLKFVDANGYITDDYNGERSEIAILSKICDVYQKCF